jgi:hypothetical protein
MKVPSYHENYRLNVENKTLTCLLQNYHSVPLTFAMFYLFSLSSQHSHIGGQNELLFATKLPLT